MQTIQLKTKILRLMILGLMNVLLFILVDISMKYTHGRDQNSKVRIPSTRFWKKLTVSEAFWNRRQQLLDHIHNPLFASAIAAGNDTLMDAATIPAGILAWINDTSPEDPCAPDHSVASRVKDYDQLPQRFKDFLRYMRCRSYPMVLNVPDLCQEPPFLLLAVKSLSPHFDRRQAIRQSWGRAGTFAGHKVVTVFLLGNAASTDHFPDLSGMVQHESALHGDILQWNYRDTFFNLTVKEVLFLEWLHHSCPGVSYIFKGDDDVFVNTHRILNYLGGLRRSKSRDLFIGDVITGAGPHRNKKLKYYIPESVFQGNYPPYAGGGGYIYSGDVAMRLYNASQKVSLYPIDDVYTGMCLQKIGLLPEKHKDFKTFNIDEKYRDNACIYSALMLVHSRTPQEVIQIWSWLQDPGLRCQAVTKVAG
ncbi:N-acetyllactosaminide beta-1,3-N-acetylglucosaminyltransferase 2-like [Alosa sapidissima]|uniref:N-acetyllactosaminide beta-1,3-N-acetylglucosaminyltransferase 2-like n=1 Tax=Alosa sapidissima TaxID=34773 RepID=UPI001C09F6EF|nr:N-acetyllactosaminide beta-1,3-N-acetylglucosaminyltransferase 2-like [Alosa sapidissima]XP_041959615.1 N-acetyllactosaminide beta-1,3-N-acetylglucosaminyltransferase 2-like [Alosa sapidissima]